MTALFLRPLASPIAFVLSCSVLLLHSATTGCVPIFAAAPADRAEKGASPSSQRPGTEKRDPWTTSNVRGTPNPPLPYRAERVFPNISFRNPTVLTNAPGTDRFFIAEQTGIIYSIPNHAECHNADPFLDTEELVERLAQKTGEDLEIEAVYGLTFHPQFETNRYCYLCYVVHYKDGKLGQHPVGTRVSRLTVSQTNPPRCDPESELEIITWLQGGHNGGCVKFGKDGYLYISSGDGGFAFPPDGLNSGQDVSHLLSKILRIDVDHPDGDRPYSIPRDNPFVGLAGARGETWAYGLRNPWKMSIDRKTGDLWVGDVGWELWELVYRVKGGDNYGWSIVEGRQPVHLERERGPTPIVPPTVEIPHTDGASVTGGFVYRGKKLPELVGTYVFGDWETRRIWGVSADAPEVGPRRELVEPSVRIVDFSEDNAGELYLLDHDTGTIHALVRNPPPKTQHKFPRRLSETGLFTSVKNHTPAKGVLPFSINAPQWSDHANAERWIAVPESGVIAVRAMPKRFPGSMFSRRMDFPADSVLVKTLSLEMEQGNPATRRRIETQLLHFDGREWRGYSYRWNNEQTDADLVDAEGAKQTLTIVDPEAPRGQRRQTWSFPSRTDCLRCHNPWVENTLAFNTLQLNRDHDYGSVIANQIRTFRHIGLWMDEEFELAAAEGTDQTAKKVLLANSPDEIPRLPNPFDPNEDLIARGRAYLDVHCAMCHRDNGGGSAYVHLSYDLPLGEGKKLAIRPSQGTFGIPHAQIAAPGDPCRSVLYFRMSKLGPGHMPHIGSSIVDVKGVELIHEWIRNLPTQPDSPPALPRPAALDRLTSAASDFTESERQRLIDEMLSTSSHALMLVRAVRQRMIPGSLRPFVIAAGVKHADAAVRDLFESFVPEEERAQRLGDTIRPDQILRLSGDIERGKQLFHKGAGIQCKNCHRIGTDGTELGPDLTQVGKKYDRAKIFENILEPSKSIEPQYVTWVVESKDGKVHAGLLVRKNAEETVLKDSQNKEQRIAAGDIESSAPLQKSLMPELLVRDMTAQQVADLLAYLESLK